VPSLYKVGSDGSKTIEANSVDAMTGIKGPDEEVDLIDFKD
jgi:hypothetical protein